MHFFPVRFFNLKQHYLLVFFPVLRIVGVSIGLLGYESAVAQLVIHPNYTWYKPYLESKNSTYKPKIGILNLPFFDDFSTYTGSPDTSLWMPNSGTFVNQEVGIRPISKGIISFDGLNQNNQPYQFSNVVVEAIGLADTLVSKPIQLAGLTPSDSVYLSFYWQREGLGETPDIVDSIRLQFKDNQNIWHTVWQKKGGGVVNEFEQVLIPLKNPNFFFSGFQFQFQAFGRLSGAYDVWHLDYIYLNNDRRFDDSFVEEIATSVRPNFFLKRYTAMPIRQFFANPTEETNTELKSTLNNLSGSGIDVIRYDCILEDTISKTQIAVLKSTDPFVLAGNASQFELNAPIAADLLNPNAPQLAIRSKFVVITGDNDLTIPPIDLKRNDTIESITVLDDYYAYDDGIAEYGAGVNQRFGQVAVRFFAHQKDTLTDVLLHITKFEKDLTGQTFNLVIWKEIGTQDSILYKVNVPIRYPNTRDGFVSVKEIKKLGIPDFQFPIIAVEGTFFVGWEQTTNDRMTVGYDRNTNSVEHIFFNVGNQWQAWDAEEDELGSLMLRPLFGNDIVTSIGDKNPPLDLKIYPNPTSQFIFLEGKKPLQSIWIDAFGREIEKSTVQELSTNKWKMDITNLPAGMYILKLIFADNRVHYQRIVLQK